MCSSLYSSSFGAALLPSNGLSVEGTLQSKTAALLAVAVFGPMQSTDCEREFQLNIKAMTAASRGVNNNLVRGVINTVVC